MAEDQEKLILDRIIGKIETLSQSTEYKVREIFKNLGYFSDPYHYEDFDPKKQIKVQRELDFLSSKLASKEKIDFTPKSRKIWKFYKEDLEFPQTSWVSLIGDVKYIKGGKINIVGFIDESLSQMGYSGAFSTQLIKYLIMNDIKDLPQTMKLGEFNFPLCRQLVFFDKNGGLLKIESKKYTIHNICNQIISGFNAQKSIWEKQTRRGFNILIPLLVYGNEIEFITGSPTDIIGKNYESPDAIVYRFAPSTSFENITVPIFICSLKKLQSNLKAIENYLEVFFDFEIQFSTHIPHTLNVA